MDGNCYEIKLTANSDEVNDIKELLLFTGVKYAVATEMYVFGSDYATIFVHTNSINWSLFTFALKELQVVRLLRTGNKIKARSFNINCQFDTYVEMQTRNYMERISLYDL